MSRREQNDAYMVELIKKKGELPSIIGPGCEYKGESQISNWIRESKEKKRVFKSD